jgi:hypothetical protein
MVELKEKDDGMTEPLESGRELNETEVREGELQRLHDAWSTEPGTRRNWSKLDQGNSLFGGAVFVFLGTDSNEMEERREREVGNGEQGKKNNRAVRSIRESPIGHSFMQTGLSK